MFTRLFVPKWKHTDPRVRSQAMESGVAPPEAIVTAAREDTDPQVRCCAVQRLDDLELLSELLDTEMVIDVRETVVRRQRDLLSGPPDALPPLDLRCKVIRNSASADLCAYLVRKAKAVEIRVAVLEQINDTSLLCTIAIDDPVASVRLAALERISDPQGWEMVAGGARKRDKQISRLARERLQAHRRAEEDRELAERLCQEMEELAAGEPAAGMRLHFSRIAGQWGGLQADISRQTRNRFRHARETAAAVIKRLETIMSERRAICDGLEDLLDRLRTGENDEVLHMEEVQESLERTVGRWQSLGQGLPDGEQKEQHFSDLVHQMQRALDRRTRDQLRAVPLESLLREARDVLNATAALDERRISQLQDRWTGLQLPESGRLAAALRQEFDSVLQGMRKRLKQQDEQRRQALEKADGLLTNMELALDRGELERVLSLRDRIRHLVKTATGAAEAKQAAGLRRRLHSMQPRVDHLKDWRHWGSRRARERLCSEIEALTGSAHTAADIAARVRNARVAWKRIDRAEGPAGEDLWQRFDQSCTRAYEPYQHERKEQAARLDEHLQRKQVLCRELDAFERETDWKQVDWRAADQQVHKARRQWRRIGPVPRKARKSLEQTYREVLERLESRLDTERGRELRRRRALIARVEELVDFKDPRAASREVKQLQATWRPTVQASPTVEQTLWKQFRTACDAVFARINQEHEAVSAALENNLSQKMALCDKLDGLLESADLDGTTLVASFADAGREWGRIGSVSHKNERAVEARYEAINRRFAERRHREERAAAEAELRMVEQRSRLCESLEREALEMTLTDHARQSLLDSAYTAWQALGPAHEVVLQERFELASEVLGGDERARKKLFDSQAGNLEQRLQLCLQLEIAAEIDSPPEYADARMQLQVSRLSDALHHRQASSSSAADRLRDLQLAWYRTGPVPRDAQGELEERFGRVMAALKTNDEV